MPLRIGLGLGITVVMFAIAGRRFYWLSSLIGSGQPAPGRFTRPGKQVEAELVEVGGQRKLLKWTVPGLAHFFTFWGFTILILTIIEAYGCLFDRDFHIPAIGTWSVVGFLEDFFTAAVLVSLLVFAVIRVKNSPAREERDSRFYGSHTGAAWMVLVMIALVMLTLVTYRAAQVNTGNFPYTTGPSSPTPWPAPWPRSAPGSTASSRRWPCWPTSPSSPAFWCSCPTRSTSTSSWRPSTCWPPGAPGPSARWTPRPT